MMKRINPETGKPFKSGDARADGMVFRSYQLTRKLPSDPQYYYENWRTQEDFDRVKASDTQRVASFNRKQKTINRNHAVKGRRLVNPDTGAEYKFGDRDEKRTKFFNQYDDWRIDDQGYSRMMWISSLEQLERTKSKKQEQAKTYLSNNRLSLARISARRRAKKGNIRFELETEYLKSIFPSDGLCPVFKIPLVWGGEGAERGNSPSLDRIIPELGYVEGNVVWISNRANILKRDASWEELQKVASWLKSITPK